MQIRGRAGLERAGAAGGRPGRPNFSALGRGLRYLRNYRLLAAQAYLFLFLSTGAQLLVPQVVQQMIDSVATALPRPAGLAVPAVPAPLPVVAEGAESALWYAALLILLFSLARLLRLFSELHI